MPMPGMCIHTTHKVGAIRKVEQPTRECVSNGPWLSGEEVAAAAAFVSTASCVAIDVDIDMDRSQCTRMSSVLAARTCLPTLVASASDGMIDRAAETVSPFSSENVWNMVSKGSVCSKKKREHPNNVGPDTVSALPKTLKQPSVTRVHYKRPSKRV